MRISRAFVFCAAFTYLALAAAAFALYPRGFNPLQNWLSDLGNPLANPKGAFLYNAGCIAAALLLILFYLDLKAWRTGDKVLGILLGIAQASGIFASLALILAGIFDIGRYPSAHSLFSMLLCFGLTWFLSFVNTALLRHPRFWQWLGFYGFASAAAAMIYGIFFNRPLGEWISIAMFIVYLVLLALNASCLKSPAPKSLCD